MSVFCFCFYAFETRVDRDEAIEGDSDGAGGLELLFERALFSTTRREGKTFSKSLARRGTTDERASRRERCLVNRRLRISFSPALLIESD